MTSEQTSYAGQRRSVVWILAIAFAALLAGALAIPRAESFFVERAEKEGEATLRIVAGGVNQLAQRYEPLPVLFAERASILHVLQEPGNKGLIPFVNEQLRQSALSVGASDIFVMDPNGLTIAASNYRADRPFIGQNFSFRPYFQEAVAGQSSRYHALGTTSGERGFFFASPVLDGSKVSGVTALKVSVDDIESSWSGLGRDIAIADPNGVIFLSSRADWLFRTLSPLNDGTRAHIEETRQFPLSQMQPLNVSGTVIGQGAVELSVAGPQGTEAFLVESLPIVLPGWHAIVFSPTAPARTSAIYLFLIWALVVAVLALLSFIVVQRRMRFAERMRIQHSERQLLEKRVQERTADLNTANAVLKIEVEDRKTAEERLRKTQKDLVQAGKLAALGQMSAALSHEINQPLTAVISYADNAATFLERDRIDDAKDNITRISQMADRMARISGHLRNFARRPGDKLNAVPIGAMIDEAISITAPQLNSRNAKIKFDRPADDIMAIGGRLRLQQVLVNIFSNALDAMSDTAEPFIEVSVTHSGEQVQIDVRDHGPGLADTTIDQAFEPFFSTKEGGEGMGLGLSISYNIVEDFGGRLTVRNHPEGGAIFGVMLRRAFEQQMVAE